MTRKDNGKYRPDVAVPPGATLLETLKSMGLTQTEFARRVGRPIKTINEIVKGKAAITPETAVQFERVLRIPARFWLNLEQNYQETKARLKLLQQETGYLRSFPYAEMAKWGWIPRATKPTKKVDNLLRFFNVASLKSVLVVQPTVYRKSKGRNCSAEALASWLRQGEILAEDIDVQPFNRRTLKRYLPEFRRMTRLVPEQFQDALVQQCASSGIALVFVPHLQHTYVNGAARWLSPQKALIQLSLRYKYNDVFWFTFFHELGHILLHGNKECFIDVDDGDPSEKEREADRFAADTLMPPDAYSALLEKGFPTKQNIQDLARSIHVSPAVVVGRLQHDKVIGHDRLNDLRIPFEWSC